MNKAKILMDLENMVVSRLFGPQPWLADRETSLGLSEQLLQMGLIEIVCVEPCTWKFSSLGKELDVDLFEVFLGLIYEWEVPTILERYGLINESEVDIICTNMDKANAESVLSEYVKRAYFKYHNAGKFAH
jgi:hypothetical protein